MKKLSYTFLLIAILSACNSEKEKMKDEFLSDTIWKWEETAMTPDENISEENVDGFSKMLELFPDVKYSLGEISEVQKDDTLFHSGEYKTAYLNFGKNVCSYKEECYQKVTIKQYNLQYRQYTFNAGIYNNNHIGILEVTKDGIYLNKYVC